MLRPFINATLNELETLSLVTSMITVYCGLYYISDASKTKSEASDMNEKSVELSQGMKMFFFLVILLVNLLFLFTWIYSTFLVVQYNFMTKFPRIYMNLILCGNTKKFTKQVQEQQIREENDRLFETYQGCMRKLVKLQKTGELVLNKNTMEKIQMYLLPANILKIAGASSQNFKKMKSKTEKRKSKHNQDNVTETVYETLEKDDKGNTSKMNADKGR